MDAKMKISIRIIVFSIIIIICIVALSFGIYLQFFKKMENKTNPDTTNLNVNQEQLAKDFKNIFHNTLDYQGHDVIYLVLLKLNQVKI